MCFEGSYPEETKTFLGGDEFIFLVRFIEEVDEIF
jgi:hypothetical protein